MFHPCLFPIHAPWIVVKTTSIINDPINSLHWFLLGCQSDGEPAGGELGHRMRFAFALNQHFVGLWSWGETAGLGADCWCSQFTVMMSFLLPEKPHMPRWGWVPSGSMPLSNKALGQKEERLYIPPCWYTIIFFWHTVRMCWEGGWRSLMGERTDEVGD